MNSEVTVRSGNKSTAMGAAGRFCIAGFTLLEILTAVFILAIILTTVFGSYRFVLGNADRLDDDIALHEMAQTCLDRISRDLSALYIHRPPQYRKPTADAQTDPFRIFARTDDIDGQPLAFLRFTTLAHLPMEKDRRDGIAEITYYVQKTDSRQHVLRRADRLWPYPSFSENPGDPVLCEYIRSFRFVFLDAKSSPYDHWDSDDNEFGYATPSAVTVRLELEHHGNRAVMETTVAPPLHREKTD